MTQQPYYPPQYPQQPQTAPPPQQYPAQPQYPQAPPPGYGAPQHYPAHPPQQQAPHPPPVNGNLDDFYSQPGAGTGPSLSWKDKPLGTTYAGIVARDVTDGDVQQQTDPSTGAPKTFRDGRPMFVMKVPLKVQPTQEFPEGEATYYVRGQARDELVRAMSEAGCDGSPKGGAGLVVTLVQRRPSRMGNPANIVQIRYSPPNGQPHRSAPVQQQAPVPDAPSPAPGAGAQLPPQTGGPGIPVPEVPQSAYAPGAQPLPPPGPAVPQQAVQQPPAPPQGPAQPQPPADLTPDQQQLLARLTGQQPG